MPIERVDDRGFGLVEVLVAAGALSVVMLALSSLTTFNARTVASTEATTDFVSLVSVLNSLFDNTDTCAQAIKVQLPIVSGNPVFNASSLPSIAALPPMISAIPGTFGKIKLAGLAFTSASSVGSTNTQYYAKLTLQATKSVGGTPNAVGGNSLQHDFQLLITVDPTTGNAATGYKFLNCSGFADSLWVRAADNVDIYYPNGKVGIGTPAPAAQLDVEGGNMIVNNGTLTGGVPGGTTGIVSVNGYATPGPTGPGTYAAVDFTPTGSPNNTWGIQYRTDGTLQFGYFPANTEALVLTQAGGMGVGTQTPSAQLEVAGNILADGTVTASSDARMKKNIQEIPDPLAKLLALRGVEYQWKTDKFPERHLSPGTQVGLIAQDVEKVLPEAVSTDRKGFKALNYNGVVALLVQSLKEQQREIDELRTALRAKKAHP